MGSFRGELLSPPPPPPPFLPGIDYNGEGGRRGEERGGMPPSLVLPPRLFFPRGAGGGGYGEESCVPTRGKELLPITHVSCWEGG